jgi:hypothetical protein
MKYVVHDMLRSTYLGMFYRHSMFTEYSVRKIDEYSVFEYSEKSESNRTTCNMYIEGYLSVQKILVLCSDKKTNTNIREKTRISEYETNMNPIPLVLALLSS